MPNAVWMKQTVNLQTGYHKDQHCCTFTSACSWGATSSSILNNGGGIKGNLCPGKGRPGVMQPKVGLDEEEVSAAAPHLMIVGISYCEELCGLG